MQLNDAQKKCFARDGFLVLRQFAPAAAMRMLPAAVAIARSYETTTQQKGRFGDALLQPEGALSQSNRPLAERLSKIFRIHRDHDFFFEFAGDPAVTDLVASFVGADADCFLSQFIFKHPGALGQPWHQDAFYFPFSGSTQIGLWLAVTAAHERNGPLWVLPGSHKQPIHAVVKDQRPHANAGYVEIVSQNTDAAQPVLMEPGDLLLFHSHLMHRSTDNASDELRAAMVYHYANASTLDQSNARYGNKPANQDWLPILRQGRRVV